MRRPLVADVVLRGMLFAAVLILCFVPFLIDLQSLAGRSQASGFVRRFGLSDQDADAARRVLTSPSRTSATINGLSWVFFILGSLLPPLPSRSFTSGYSRSRGAAEEPCPQARTGSWQ